MTCVPVSPVMSVLALSGHSAGTALALLLAAITFGLGGLILFAADATERESRKW
jgi:ABC-type transporter lipoprotein component MlaA